MIFRAYQRDSCGGGRAREWIERANRDSTFALGYSRDPVSEAAHALRAQGTPYCCDPSTGLHAVLTMGLACESVELFGFAGSTTIDDHPEGHAIEAEHALLRKLADKELPAENFNDWLRPLWPYVNLIYKYR